MGNATANDTWTVATRELAGKIVAAVAPQTRVGLTMRNVSSLGDEDVAQIRRALRNELRSRKIQLTPNKSTGVDVQLTLSENFEGFIWVAEIQNGSSHDIAMVTVARPAPEVLRPPREPLAIRKTRVYQQADPLLDVVALTSSVGAASGPGAPATTSARLLVLGVGAVSLYQDKPPADKAPQSDIDRPTRQLKFSMPIPRLRPWPRDVRGRLVVQRNSQFDVYLPGEKCTGSIDPPGLQCQEGDEPWPIGVADAAGSTGPAAYLAPDRGFFDGRVRLEDGREIKAPPFFAAAELLSVGGRRPVMTSENANAPRWLLTGLDDRAQLINGDGTSIAAVGSFGSNFAALQTGCRNGWQILATAAGDRNEGDAVQAYELVDRKAVEASTPAEFSGPVMELWPLANGSEAMAITHNLKTAMYEAFRLSISCGQ
jgi:hypothetical protein